jgi:hypothetical protein
MHSSPFQPLGAAGSSPPQALVQHPLAFVSVYVGAVILIIWAAYQVRYRCQSCGSLPARCRCA